MAITKETVVDKIEVLEKGQVQIRTATVIKEDDAEISRTFHRHFVVPCTKVGDDWEDTDISNETAQVQAICNASWTNEVKTAYKTFYESQEIL